jgi:hypothetical protein
MLCIHSFTFGCVFLVPSSVMGGRITSTPELPLSFLSHAGVNFALPGINNGLP